MHGFDILALPRELRNEIYRHALVRSQGCVRLCDYDGSTGMEGDYKRPCVGVNLLRANKQIYAEAVELLYSQNIFAIAETQFEPHNSDFLWPMGSQNRGMIKKVELVLSPRSSRHYRYDWYLSQVLPSLKETTLLFEWATHFIPDSQVNSLQWVHQIQGVLCKSPGIVRWDFSQSRITAEEQSPQIWRKEIPRLIQEIYPEHDFSSRSRYWDMELRLEDEYFAARRVPGRDLHSSSKFSLEYLREYSKVRHVVWNRGLTGPYSNVIV